MIIHTRHLTGNALNFAVVYARSLEATGGKPVLARDLAHKALDNGICQYTTSWADAGPLIKSDKIALDWSEGNNWCASSDASVDAYPVVMSDEEPLVAAMRAFVAGRLGGMVDVPEKVSG